MKLLQLKIYKS